MIKKSITILCTLLLASFLVGIFVFFINFKEKSQITLTTVDLGATPVYMASKKGSTFGLPWCGVIPRIKDENTLIFSHKTEAVKAGFRELKHCSGL